MRKGGGNRGRDDREAAVKKPNQEKEKGEGLERFFSTGSRLLTKKSFKLGHLRKSPKRATKGSGISSSKSGESSQT